MALLLVLLLLVRKLGEEDFAGGEKIAPADQTEAQPEQPPANEERRSLVPDWQPEALPEGGAGDADGSKPESRVEVPPREDSPDERASSRVEGEPDEEAGRALTNDERFGEGRVFGRVTYEGPIPDPERLEMREDPKCRDIATEEDRLRRKITLNDEGGLAGAVVWVELAGGPSYPPPEEKIVLRQVGCRFRPDVLAIQAGQHLEIHNDDPLLHNVHAHAKRSEFNQAMPKQGMKILKRFKVSDPDATYTCEVHPWMSGRLFIFSHPFFAVTDASGSFTIDRLPGRGPWHLVVQHPYAGGKEVPAANGKVEVHLAKEAR